jgi:eukaryotic-like serine/threonine-protein kinase
MTLPSVKQSARPPSVRRSPEPVERALREGLIGARVEGFVIEAELGRGGMGAVLRASDRLLGRSVALKVLGDSTRDHALLRRFVVEAQLGAQLEHPNIVPFYEFLATAEGRPAFAMKLVDGETLDGYLEECGSSAARARTPPHDLWSRLDRFLKICDAIDYAHARGVVHRDLKPGNVMLGSHNEVYVMDWGVARVLDDPQEPRREALRPAGSGAGLTEDGEVVGTPAYMAPEQARCEAVTPAMDQYALGMLLAELLTLQAPRRGSSRQQLSDALLGAPPLLEPRFDGPLPRELLAVVRKATALRPEHRYASVVDLAADVRRFVRDEPVSVLRDRSWLRLWRRVKRHPQVVLGTIAVCLLLSLSLAVLLLGRELSARDQRARSAQNIFALTSAVDRTARQIDAQLRRVELLLEGLGRSASEVLRREPHAVLEALTPAELGQRGLAVQHARYGQPVSFERSIFVRSPNVALEALTPVLARLADLEPLLVSTAARSAAGDQALGLPDPERRQAAREHASITWTDLAFESGVVLVYPGNTFFPAGFEARERSWYTATRGGWGPVWGSPYPDATSGALLIACSSAFPAPDGSVAGVAALHLSLEAVLQLLSISGVAGYRGAALLDPQGDVVLTERTREQRTSPGLHQNKALQRVPFEVAEVRAAILAGARQGRVQSGSQLTVFERLDSAEWLLAVNVDGEPYGLR